MIKKMILGLIAAFTMTSIGFNYVSAREIVEVPHWQKSTITIYIPKDGNKKATGSLRSAFSKWQSVSCGNLKFKYVDEGPADINVVFTENANGDSPYTSTKIRSDGTAIKEAEINIASEKEGYNKLPAKYVSNVMIHEVGKALGVPVNTTKKSSIMYLPITDKQYLMKVDERKLFSISDWSYSKRNLNK